ncbi:HMG box domain-containing protein [Plasmodiophora brassicae]|uniref:HMG box domain-containing protein n=1 Tax=Plasmodiophora brassicae TaxID=37360 RepID=A0A0G4IU88_PLABS|nr:hypothetical protein PBRA_007027 [Plasmodiophora brassicae]
MGKVTAGVAGKPATTTAKGKAGKAGKTKRAATGWMLFMAEQRPVLAAKGVDARSIMKQAAVVWKGMTDREKAKYNDQAKKAAATAAAAAEEAGEHSDE